MSTTKIITLMIGYIIGYIIYSYIFALGSISLLLPSVNVEYDVIFCIGGLIGWILIYRSHTTFTKKLQAAVKNDKQNRL